MSGQELQHSLVGWRQVRIRGVSWQGDVIVILFTRQLNERNLSLGELWSCGTGWMWIEGSSSNTGYQSSRSGSRLARVAWPRERGGKVADDEGDDPLRAGDHSPLPPNFCT
ncbi:hypothetical protein MRX96_014707 [Rhipicephalus microplus]